MKRQIRRGRYHAELFGSKQGSIGEMGDIVKWSSITVQFGGAHANRACLAEMTLLARDRTALAPTATSCAVATEVGRDGSNFRFGTLAAFGSEADFFYPCRPTDMHATRRWSARIRQRSTTNSIKALGLRGDIARVSGQRYCRQRGRLNDPLGGALGGGWC